MVKPHELIGTATFSPIAMLIDLMNHYVDQIFPCQKCKVAHHQFVNEVKKSPYALATRIGLGNAQGRGQTI